jgi:hemolysin activation/secretion protein
MLKSAILAAVLLATSLSAFAQIPPRSGSQMQQIPPAPVPQKSIPEVRIEPSAAPAPAGSDNLRFPVRSLRITGQTLYSEADLLAVTGFVPGGDVSLADLRGIAARIADHYHRNGYFVAQAYLPAQDIKDGSATIAVLEGRYGKVNLNNQSKLRNSQATGLLSGLNSGDPIAIAPLENRLLLLSDTPGVAVKSTLVPGAAVGTSDLNVDIADGRLVTGSVEADNAGNYYTGEYRVGASVYLNNALGLGDLGGLRVITSGSGLTYGRGFYQVQAGKFTLGAAYSALEYKLGKEFSDLRAHGTAEVASLYASYPLIRSRSSNLYAMVGYDLRTYQDKVDATVPPSVTDKQANVWMASLYGNHRDRFGGGGLSSFTLTLSAGDLDIQTPAALAIDQATARTNGSYGKLYYNAARLQTVTDNFSLYAGISGQFASKNLDISEKMSLGGPYAVRAYPVGEAYADEGYVVNLEARYRLPRFADRMVGDLYLIGFVDTGSVKTFENPWFTGPNHRTLSAAGLGVNWVAYNNFTVSAYWAHKLGNDRATSVPASEDSGSRFWVQGVKYF